MFLKKFVTSDVVVTNQMLSELLTLLMKALMSAISINQTLHLLLNFLKWGQKQQKTVDCCVNL